MEARNRRLKKLTNNTAASGFQVMLTVGSPKVAAKHRNPGLSYQQNESMAGTE